MAGYSATDKFLHKFYLSNYSISKATLEMEEILYGHKAKHITLAQSVFVTGLARSGTTAVMNKIFDTGEYASLQYANMPFLLSPNLWNRKSNIESHERAHKDGITIDGNSPEEFDEYFWKAILNDEYILEEGLAINNINDRILNKFLTYVKLICLSKGKVKYVSKNNNNILRLAALQKIENAKIIILFRDPISHASSLMKLDDRFSNEQTLDPFALEYFDYLGHHEFGLHHKPFLLTREFDAHRNQYSKTSLNYWLAVWLNYYKYVLAVIQPEYLLVCFEDLVAYPNAVYANIMERLLLKSSFAETKPHSPSQYLGIDCDSVLLKQCNNIYIQLTNLRTYQV